MPLSTMLGILFLDPIAVAFAILTYPIILLKGRRSGRQQLKDLHPDTLIYDQRRGKRVTAREALLTYKGR